MLKIGVTILALLLTSAGVKAQPPRQPVTHKYRCTVLDEAVSTGPYTVLRRGFTSAIMFNETQSTVYFLGGRAPYSSDPGGLLTWTYEDQANHRQMVASFNPTNGELHMHGAHWRCNYEGAGP